MSRTSSAPVAILVGLLTILPVTGCSLISNAIFVVRGAQKKAEFADLKGKRVAVVCVVDPAATSDTNLEVRLHRAVDQLLRRNVEEIDLVRPDEVDKWLDGNDWDRVDFREVGRGLKADMIVAINLSGLSSYEGRSLLRGHADVRVVVHDMRKGGGVVFEKVLADQVFPESSGVPEGTMNPVKFHAAFAQYLANRIARMFYSYDLLDAYSEDARLSEF